MTGVTRGDDRWEALPRERTRRAGPPGATSREWSVRLSAIALLASAAWFIATVLRPLPLPPSAAPEAVPALPPLTATEVSIEERSARLARLTEGNIFDAQREPWLIASASPVGAGDDAPTTTEAAAENKGQPVLETVRIDGKSIEVSSFESLPDDVKQAFNGLALRGIYAPRGGGPAIAMISMIHEGPTPFISRPYRSGEQFTDPKFPQAPWKVELIDAVQSRVVVSRSGHNLALMLYGASAAAPRTPAVVEAAAPPEVPQVIERTRDEVVADLRAANVPEEQIARLLELIEMDETRAAAQAALDALEKPVAQADEPKKGKRAPPPGMEAVLKMMRSAGRGEEPEPAPEPPETPQ